MTQEITREKTMTLLTKLALQTKSIEEFISLAQQQGHRDKDEQTLLKELHREWKEYATPSYGTIHRRPEKIMIPSLETTVNQKKYRVYGVVHEDRPSRPYLKAVRQTCLSTSRGLWEQFVSETFNLEEEIEIPDHAAERYRAITKIPDLFQKGLIVGCMLPFTIIFGIRRTTRHNQQNQNQNEPLTIMEALTLCRPLTALSPTLPIHLQLELTEREKPVHYSRRQQRSAYQAEFLRAWKNKDSEKNIFVGAAHAPEIIHFLEKGVRNDRIIDLAQSHAEVLNTDPLRFYHLCNRIKRRENAVNILIAYSGVISPYLGLYSLL